VQVWVSGPVGSQVTYARDPGRLLRPGGEGRGEEAAAQHSYERPTIHHSITRSAPDRMDGGIVRPSALAVLRLMTSSNFVGCSMGRPAGTRIEAQWGHGCEGAGPAVTSRCQPGCNHFPSRRTNISVRRPRRVRSAPPDWNTTSKRP